MTHPVWEFVSNDEPDETYVYPLAERPTKSLENRIVGAEVELANGSRVWALLGNIDVHGATSTLSAGDIDALYLYIQTIE